jgi:hypothetical protein
MEDYYVYVYLDPRKPGVFNYGGIEFPFEPFYIGKGTRGRCYSGIRDKKSSRKVSKINSIIKGGEFPIIMKIEEGLTNKESQEKEITYIKKIGRMDLELGPLTNMTSGGDGGLGLKHSEEWKKILSKPILQFNLDGEFLDEYASVKEAAEKTGIVKQNISSNLTGKYKTAGGFFWRYKDPLLTLQGHLKKSFEMPKHSEETKKKMSSSAKKGEDHHMKNKTGVNNPRSKKIIQKSLEGDEIKVWNSMSDINRELGFTPSNICRCCQGSVKRIGGFRWEYYIQ